MSIIYRLITPQCFTRVEVPQNGTILNLKKEIEKISNVPPNQQNLFLDHKYTKKITLADSKQIKELKLKEGETIFLQNSSKPQNQTNQNQKNKKNENQKSKKTENIENSEKITPKCNHSENEVCINCIEKKNKKEKKKDEKEKKNEKIKNDLLQKSGLTSKCNHPVGQKCINCMGKVEYKGELKYTCQHGEGGKCPNCINKEYISNAKHISFDQYVNDRKQKCKGTHEMNTICINCMPPSQIKYIKKKNCPNHPEEQICNECMPPNVILNRQIYRHVDYVSFMNQEEINLFLQPWINSFFQKQRMGYLFGYYSKDPNYINGVRAVVEALYEPPQIGDYTSVRPLQDRDIEVVDRIAKELTLEVIGWIFTGINEPGIALSSYDIRKAAKFQQEYIINHPSGCKISRFITCIVKPNDEGNCEIETYMVSDMCQALERDKIFDNLDDKKRMKVRKENKGEIMPTIYMEGKPTQEFDPDFFIVNIAHGVPTDKKDQNILKSYDFPAPLRTEKGIVTENMIKDYFKRHKSDLPLIKCASFYFLIFIGKTIDLESAATYARQIANGTIDWDVLESILSTYVGYS